MSINVYGQDRDSTEISEEASLEIAVGLSNGLYNISEIDGGLYHSEGYQFSYLSHLKLSPFADGPWIAFIVAYTGNEYFLQKISAGTYAFSPNIKKEMAVLDLGFRIGYNILHFPGGTIFTSVGYSGGMLTKGETEITGIYEIHDKLAPCCPQNLFNDRFHNFLLSLGANYMTSAKLGVELNGQIKYGTPLLNTDLYRESQNEKKKFTFNIGLLLFYEL